MAAARAAKAGSSGLSPLRVSHLRALIVSRTGHLAKASSNKDGALKLEAESCIQLPVVVRTPSPSPPRAVYRNFGNTSDLSSDSDIGEGLDADFFGEA